MNHGHIKTRKPHYLRPNHAVKFPHRLLFIDTETKLIGKPEDGMNRFRIGVSCYIKMDWKSGENITEQWREYYKVSTFLEEIEKRTFDDSPLHVYASNISFDIAASMLHIYFTEKGWKCQVYYEKGLTFILILKLEKHTIKFLSMQNFIPTSIAKIGVTLGYEKGKIDFADSPIPELMKYCRRDVEILKQALIGWYQFVKDHDLGGAGLTLAGQSIKAFRHRFMNHKILIYCDENMNAFERNAYHGGRVECFRIGKQPEKPYTQIDINSLYPFVMQKYNYPTKFKGFIEAHNLDLLKQKLKYYAVTALVYVETNEPLYISHMDNRTCFPIGKFWTYLTTRELLYAFDHGHIRDVSAGIYYTQKPLFKPYVDYLYEMRMKYQDSGNKPYNLITKLLMNSLYGKFGEKRDIVIESESTESNEFMVQEYYDAVTGVHGTERIMFHIHEILSGQRDGANAFPAISGHITADGRLELWKYIRQAGIENVLYCDTDSLIIDEQIYKEKLIHGSRSELGAHKIECKSSLLTLYNLKDYRMGDKRVLKGVQRITNKHGIEKFHSLHSYGLSTLARKGISGGAILRPIEMSLKREYQKGYVRKDGIVEPFVLGEPCNEPVHPLSNLYSVPF